MFCLLFVTAKKIDKHLYHELYMQSKGNQYKNKRVLMEAIHAKKTEANRQKLLVEQVWYLIFD